MKRIYKNHDVLFDLNVNNFPINFDLIKTIDLKFYTTNPLTFFSKSEKDINEANKIVLTSQELDQLNEGVLFYKYQVVLVDSVMPDKTFDTVANVMSEYYLANDNHNGEPILESDIRWGKISGNIEDQNDLMNKFSEFYPKTDIDKKIEDLVSGDINLENYYTKQDIEDKQYLQAKDIECKLDKETYEKDKPTFATKVDCEATYVTKSELAGKNYLQEHQSLDHLATKNDLNDYQPVGDYVTPEILDSKGFITEHQSLLEYAKKVEIPTNVSQLNNDVPYLTTHQSLDEYAKKNELPTKVSQFINDVPYLTTHQPIEHLLSKDEAVKKYQPLGEYITPEVLNSKGYLTAVPAEYVTETELASKGFISEHQSLVDYAKKTDIPKNVSELKNDVPYLIHHQDLSHLATKEEANQKADINHKHDEYLTSKDIADKADRSELTNYQVSGDYVTNIELENKKYLTSIPDFYITEQELENKNYLTAHQNISHLATKDELSNYQPIGNYITPEILDSKHFLTEHQPLNDYAKKTDIPKNVSQLTNDVPYLIHHQDISHLATKNELSGKADIKHIHPEYLTSQDITGKVDVTAYTEDKKSFATKSELAGKSDTGHTHSQYLTAHQSLAGYAKEDWVNQQIDEKVASGGTVALSNYYKKSETYSKDEIDQKGFLTSHQNISHLATKSELANYQPIGNYVTNEVLDSKGYLTAVPAQYVTEQELENKNYLTTHQSLDHLATKVELAGKADVKHTHSEYLTEHQSLVAYAKKNEIPSKTSELINDEGFIKTHQDISGKLDTTVYDADKVNYATKNELAGKAEKEHTHDQYLTAHQSLEGYATESYVNDKLSGVTVDLSDYYKKNETYSKDEIDKKNFLTEHQPLKTINGQSLIGSGDIIIQGSGEGGTVDLSNYYKKDETYSKVEIDQKNFLTEHQDISGKLDATAYTEDKKSFALKSELPDTSNFITNETLNNKGFITEIPAEYITETELNDKHYLTSHQDISGKLDKSIYENDKVNYATKSELAGKSDTGHTHSQYLTSHQDITGKLDVTAYTEDKKSFALKSELPSLDGYATEQYVNDKMSGVTVDLSDYYKKSETYNQAEVNALIPDTSTFITDAEIEQKGYSKMVECTQSEYDMLTKDNNTLYIITDAVPEEVYSKADVDRMIKELNDKIAQLQK